MNKMWQGVIAASFLFSTSYHAHATGGLQTTKLAARISGLPSAFIVVEKKDGVVISRTSGGEKSLYFYDEGRLARTERTGGAKAEHFYHRNGQLDRSELSNGVTHTAQYDELGNLYAIVSTSGRGLRISGNSVSGHTAQKVSAERIVGSSNATVSVGPTFHLQGEGKQPRFSKSIVTGSNPSTTTVLLATDGWDSGEYGTDTCDEEANDPTRVVDPVQTVAATTAATAEVEPPSTDCTIVVVPGTGESGGGGSSGGSYGGGVVTDPAPGTAPADNPLKAKCLADAYEGWTMMYDLCKLIPIYSEKQLCNEGNMKTYRDAIAACHASYPN